jgi:hypothetical protein
MSDLHRESIVAKQAESLISIGNMNGFDSQGEMRGRPGKAVAPQMFRISAGNSEILLYQATAGG